MGKRELLLIVGFLIVGAVVYQATAPPANPNDKGFSFGRLIEAARREIRGNRAVADLTTTDTHALDPEVNEVRIIGWLAEVEVTGEDRADIHSSLVINSRAYTDEEAKQFARDTTLTTDRAGSSLVFRVKYLEGRQTGRQRAKLVLEIPSRFKVRVESPTDRLVVDNVAALETTTARGEATVKNVQGRVSLQRHGAPVTIEHVQALQFVGRGTELTLTGVEADTSIRLEGGGEFTASELRGALDVEARNAEITMPKLQSTKGPIRVNLNGGSAKLHGIKADTRIDARNAEVDVVALGGAPLTIYHDGEDVVLTLPAGGYRLDAVVTGGRISTADGGSLEDLGLSSTKSESATDEVRATGTVKGGGATITIRGTRGDLTLRRPDK
jgi:hypothetical protein